MKRCNNIHLVIVLMVVSSMALLNGCNVDQVPLRFDGSPTQVDSQVAVPDSQAAPDAVLLRDVGRNPRDAQIVTNDAALNVDATAAADASPTPTDSVASDATLSDASPVDAATPTDGRMDAGLMNLDGGAAMMCVGPEPQMDANPPEAIPEGTCMNCIDAPPPIWRLADFQDDSCGTGQTYGLNSFSGRATLVALFNAGCGYCQSQARNLARMRVEIEQMDVDAHFSAINGEAYAVHQERMLDLCSFPFFQDTEMDNAIEGMNGSIYDIFVYRPDGTLHVFLDGTGDIDTYMAEEAGYENVKEALLSAVRGEPYVAPFPPVEIVFPDGGIENNPDQGK